MKMRREEGMRWVEFWADFVRTHSDKDWSRIQNNLINSQIQALQAINMSPKTYLKLKGEKCSRKD